MSRLLTPLPSGAPPCPDVDAVWGCGRALCSRQDVAFSGYKVAHPLDREVQLSVIGTGNPAQAVAECCAALTAELRRFREGLE